MSDEVDEFEMQLDIICEDILRSVHEAKQIIKLQRENLSASFAARGKLVVLRTEQVENDVLEAAVGLGKKRE